MALKNETCVLSERAEEAIADILGVDRYCSAIGGTVVDVLAGCYAAEGSKYYESDEYDEFSDAHDAAGGGGWLEAKVDLCLLLTLASDSEQGFTTIFEAAPKVPAQ